MSIRKCKNQRAKKARAKKHSNKMDRIKSKNRGYVPLMKTDSRGIWIYADSGKTVPQSELRKLND